MKMQNGPHTPKKKSKGFGGFIKDTFIILRDDSPQRKVGKLISIIALLLIVASLILGGLMVSKYIIAERDLQRFKDMRGSSEVVSEIPNESDSENDSSEDYVPPESEFEEVDENGIPMSLSELYKLNNEVIGWINIPGTKLDYPVVKRPDNNDKRGNEYYLDKTLEHKYNAFGTPFVDYRATFANGYQSDNITVYGHNSKDGAFFESVKFYDKIDYYKENPIIVFDTIYGKGEYKIIGRFTEFVDAKAHEKRGTKYDWFNYHDYVDMDEKSFNKFMERLDARNYYDSGIDVKFGDQLLTLSTCNDAIQGPTNTPYRDVLVARKVRPGEDPSVDVDKIKENKDMIMPEGWIKKFGKENPYK